MLCSDFCIQSLSTGWDLRASYPKGPMQLYGSFRKFGVPYFGVLIIRILLFRVVYQVPLFSETPIWV